MAKPRGQDLGGALLAQVESRDGGTWVGLSGNVTEIANFAPLMKLGSPLRIDMGGIQRINSLGVRGWSVFVKEAEDAGIQLIVERCAPVIVQQIAMISNFMGSRTVVRSLLVPYYCSSCSEEALQQVEVTRGAPLAVPPSMPCPKCRSAMQLDEPDAMYDNLFQQRRRA
ncbi:MAG TPA: hypothetical protein VFQ53_15300 [Kofleriaceae bacterium]|nr:hypothetical protein [Kofleriaceae bacterium]